MAPLTNQSYTVGWICALPSEMAAARAMLDEDHGRPHEQDPSDRNNYRLGRIWEHNVVLACLPAGLYGSTSAATVAAQMLYTFRSIRFGLMVGVGGGVPCGRTDVRLGDVVVGKPERQSGGVIQYDFGKTVGEGQFNLIGSLNRPPQVLLTAVSSLEADHMMEESKISKFLGEMVVKYPNMGTDFIHPGDQYDRLYESEYDHVSDENTCESCDSRRLKDRPARDQDIPTIHYGLIASANQVMKHGVTRDRLREKLDVLCFEMEAAGLMDNFPCLVIRGICDYADSHKNKRWQKYAAATAAAYAKELLCIIPTNEVTGTPTATQATALSSKGTYTL
jgi:nucleoside phosphorylase